MKKRILILLAVAASTLSLGSCNKMLDVDPEGEISTDELYQGIEGSWAAMNGAYRMLREPNFVSGKTDQAFGLASNQLTMDLMGEDLVQREQGKGWFWFYYNLLGREYYASNEWLPFEIWNQWYIIINQTNDILYRTPGVEGDQATKNNLMAQAYSLRGFAYFNLIRWYQKTYKGHEQDPGVPIYTTPTRKDRQGNGRSTVDSVYRQITADLDSADVYFAGSGVALHKSHIDKYVNYGFQSRVAMVMEKWDVAAEKAALALTKPGLQLMDPATLLTGFNSINNVEWMWGTEISESQVTGIANLWVHMDSRMPMYAQTSRKIVYSWLYDQYDREDIRKQWFLSPDSVEVDAAVGPNVAYYQKKYYAPNVNSMAGDYLFMRAAEMHLNLAEAQCRMGQYSDARKEMLLLIEPRFARPGIYGAILKGIPDGNTLSQYSAGVPAQVNLLDHIILERRKELWGEGFRLFDIIRNKTGLHRRYEFSNHSYAIDIKDPESWTFVLLIPQSEFDGNVNMNMEDDQNPSPES